MYSYMDESCDDPGTGVFVVGGLLARGVQSFELERKWESLRKHPDIDIAYFKAIRNIPDIPSPTPRTLKRPAVQAGLEINHATCACLSAHAPWLEGVSFRKFTT